jgi:hypothetical protein
MLWAERQEATMGVEHRRYPRIPYSEPGQIEAGAVKVAARFHDISCQGAELVVAPADRAHVVPGTHVQLRFQIEGIEIEIPARVVWSAGAKVGLRLRLANLSEDDKRAYADWIVPLTNKAIAHARASAAQ